MDRPGRLKLLFDQNRSPHLIERLATEFPDAPRTSRVVGLGRADDLTTWRYARTNGYTNVTKDADFGDLSILHGFPPRVVWLRLGNCTVQDTEDHLRQHAATIAALERDETTGLLVIVRGH